MRISVAVAFAAAVLTANAAQAQSSGQVILLGDAGLTCEQIVVNANEQAEILGGAPEGGVFSSEWAINAGTSYAMQGALLSGAGRALPGIGFLGNALGAAARQNRERQEAAREIAQQRWYYLNGIYMGRDCDTVLRDAASQ